MWRGDASAKKLYLTFDDGPLPEITPFVLDVLKEKDVKATFFCVGENVKRNPEIFQRIQSEGHSIGNHTYNHVNGWFTPTSAYLANVEECRKTLVEHSARPEWKGSDLFRPPYGKMRMSQYTSVLSQFRIIMWDILSGDFDKETSPEKCLNNVTSNMRNGSVIVFHDSLKAHRNMEFAMPRFIDLALEQGYQFELL
jgi:peptidoglycan/xylan/chitin deacetylase (PgdA/CDA1 family)